MNQNIRYALLAGTMLLPAIAVPQAGMAAAGLAAAGLAADGVSARSSEGAIILAQAIDPATGKPKAPPPKGAQPPPKGPPAGGPPPGAGGPPPGGPKVGSQPSTHQPAQGNAQPGGGQPPAGAGGPPPGSQQQKFGVQPKGNQPLQGNIQQKGNQPLQGNAQPGGPPPAGAGGPPPGSQQQKFGVQPKGNQPLQGNIQQKGNQPLQGNAQPGGPPPAGAGTPQGTQQQFGVQPKGNQPLQGNFQHKGNQPLQGNAQPGGQPAAGAGGPPPGGQPGQFGGQPKGNQPLQGNFQQKGYQPLQGNAQPGGPGPAKGWAVQGPPGGGHPAAVSGNVDQMRSQRQEHKEAGGRIVIEEPGRRFIVHENGRAFVRHDETERFRLWGEPRMERRGREQYAYISRPGGYQVITVTDDGGRLLRRIRRGPDGREVVLLENRWGPGAEVVGLGLAGAVIVGLAAPIITIPREQYIVDVSVAPAPLLYETLDAPPLVAIERPYSIDEIRYNVALRDRMRRIDIDSITFETGSWEIGPEQQPKLQALAEAMQQVLSQKPDEIFMIEGHTDAVGNDTDNLSLSDHRAESVAVTLTSVYQIPPENLVTQGYGEQFLKVPTDGPSRENRRVAARRITPLLQGGVASR
jgi:outer membrane protein OmpA-like peptidoglycan-associated protein